MNHPGLAPLLDEFERILMAESSDQITGAIMANRRVHQSGLSWVDLMGPVMHPMDVQTGLMAARLLGATPAPNVIASILLRFFEDFHAFKRLWVVLWLMAG